MFLLFLKKSLNFCSLVLFLLNFCLVLNAQAIEGDFKTKLNYISLGEAWKNVLKNAGRKNLASAKLKEKSFRSSLWFRTAKNFYQIQFFEEVLEKSQKMKKHFDQALAKAESSYDEGNENVTQIIITKLKLGLAEVKNNIANFTSELKQSKVELSALMGKNLFHQNLKIKRPMKVTQFDYQSWEEFLKKTPEFFDRKNNVGQGIGINILEDPELEFRVRSRKAFIRVLEARTKIPIAREVNKSLRALMAMESSNYDLGLGYSIDLFDSFMVHAKHVNDSLESIYNFNFAVAEWQRVSYQIP